MFRISEHQYNQAALIIQYEFQVQQLMRLLYLRTAFFPVYFFLYNLLQYLMGLILQLSFAEKPRCKAHVKTDIPISLSYHLTISRTYFAAYVPFHSEHLHSACEAVKNQEFSDYFFSETCDYF